MLAPSSVIKSTARTAMSGKFLKCIIACGIFEFANIICLYLSEIIGFVINDYAFYAAMVVLSVFLIFPLFLGVLRFFRRLLWGEDDGPIIVFHYFSSAKQYYRAFRFTLVFGLRYFLSALVLFVPAFIVKLFSETFFYDLFGLKMPAWISNMWVLSVFLTAAAAVVFFFVGLRWYIAPFLYVADEEMDASEAIHMSVVISRSTALEFFTLILSFVLYIAASFLMIPIIFTMPYFIAAYMVHSRYAVAQYNRVCDELSQGNVPYYTPSV